MFGSLRTHAHLFKMFRIEVSCEQYEIECRVIPGNVCLKFSEKNVYRKYLHVNGSSRDRKKCEEKQFELRFEMCFALMTFKFCRHRRHILDDTFYSTHFWQYIFVDKFLLTHFCRDIIVATFCRYIIVDTFKSTHFLRYYYCQHIFLRCYCQHIYVDMLSSVHFVDNIGWPIQIVEQWLSHYLKRKTFANANSCTTFRHKRVG